jgi:uncharacterized protein YpmS
LKILLIECKLENILPNKTNRVRFLEVFVVLTFAAMACNLPSQRNAEPSAIPLSPQEAQQFEQNLQATLTNTEPGREISVTITEGQLSSYLAAILANENDSIITNPRVRMTNGRMEILVQVKQGITIEANSVIVPSIDSNGQPRLMVESVSMGSLPVPDSIVNQIQVMVDEILEGYLASTDARFRVSKIEISKGQTVVSGTPE